jgi:hypothetical protein
MNSITAVLAWDYLRRNYMLLLICFVIAIFSIVPNSSFVAGSYYDEFPKLRAFTYNSVMYKPILIILLGMALTLPQIVRLYLKPISTFAIVTRCYLLGAFLFAIQIAIIVALWKWYYNLVDWPIVQPLLYAMICWGFFYPMIFILVSLGRRDLLAERLDLLVFVVYGVFFNVGLLSVSGNVLVAPKQANAASFFTLGLTPTVANVAVTAAVLVVGLFAILCRAVPDRSDSFIFAIGREFKDGARWLPIAETTSLRSFANSREAYQDFDSRYRTEPACLQLFYVFFVWLIASFLYSDDTPFGDNLPKALYSWVPAITAAFVFAIFLRIPIPLSLASIIWTPELNNALLQYRQYSFDSYFKSLPIADQDIVEGKLRSSFVPVAYTFPPVFLLGYFYSIMLVWNNDQVSQYEADLYEADFTPMPAGQILAISLARSLPFAFASVGVIFVIFNIQAVVTAFLITPYRWVLPLIAFSVAFYCDIPFAYSLGLGLLLSLVVVLYTFTKLASVDRERLSKAAKLIPGTCGLSLACLAGAGYAEVQSFQEVAIALLSLAFALTLMAVTALATELSVGHFRSS